MLRILFLFIVLVFTSMFSFVVQRRDGLYSIQKNARELCKFIVDFSPVIRRLYPANETLSLALDAALAACSALEAAVTAQKQAGI